MPENVYYVETYLSIKDEWLKLGMEREGQLGNEFSHHLHASIC